MSENVKRSLTDAEKARIERNRQKALHLKQAKLLSHPYNKVDINTEKATIKVHGTKFIDSGGGFLIEEEAYKNDSNKKILNSESKICIKDEILTIPITYEECLECEDKFVDSYLFNNFKYAVCDKCRDSDEKHTLITRTDAKQEYLLKDCDLDKREPILKFILRKNPHNVHWGDMKLYLSLQVEQRALEVWGSKEEIQKQRENREEKKEITKIKKYNKKMKKLRMETRSSLYDNTTSVHQHEFGAEKSNDDDTYTHTCLSCQYIETFEKM